MGNVCATREDSPREVVRQYETYTSLWNEVVAKLSDDIAFGNVCADVYREECGKRGAQQLTKQQWQEMTTSFVNRISCEDQRTKERIYRAVEELYPGTGKRLISESTFAEFTRLALTLAERDLRERIAKMHHKHGGTLPGAAPPMTAPAFVPMSGAAASPWGPPLVPNRPYTPPHSVQHLPEPPDFAAQPSPQRAGPQAEEEPPRPATPRSHAPLSSQRLRDLQRKQADQEKRLQQLLQQHLHQQQGEVGSQQQLPQPVSSQQSVGAPQPPVSNLQYMSELGPQHPRDISPHNLPMPESPESPPLRWQQQQLDYNSAPAARTPSGEQPPAFAVQGEQRPESPPDQEDKCQVSYVYKNSPVKGPGPLKPPALAGDGRPPPTAQSPKRTWAEQVDHVKGLILSGNLQASVFNNELELESKRLALYPRNQRISILRSDGLCEDSWDMDHLACITRGIGSTILAAPPPSDRSMAFRFRFKEVDEEDRYLCVVFDTAETMLLATAAFGELCEVPVEVAA